MDYENVSVTGLVTDGLWGEWNRMLQSCRTETDRAAAVLAAAFLDTALSALLQAHFVETIDADRLFSGYGPIASFSARIDLLYALGFVPEPAKRDLDFIRKIRNYFAHHPEETQFNVSPVRDWCSNLTSAEEYEGINVQTKQTTKNRILDPRDQYIMAISNALSAIDRYVLAADRRVVPSIMWNDEYTQTSQ